MAYCSRCCKEVVVYGIGSGVPDAAAIAAGVRSAAEARGQLVLFNPPLSGPLPCPACGEALDEDEWDDET